MYCLITIDRCPYKITRTTVLVYYKKKHRKYYWFTSKNTGNTVNIYVHMYPQKRDNLIISLSQKKRTISKIWKKCNCENQIGMEMFRFFYFLSGLEIFRYFHLVSWNMKMWYPSLELTYPAPFAATLPMGYLNTC